MANIRYAYNLGFIAHEPICRMRDEAIGQAVSARTFV